MVIFPLEKADAYGERSQFYSATRWYKTNSWWRSRAPRGFSITICPNLSAHCYGKFVEADNKAWEYPIKKRLKKTLFKERKEVFKNRSYRSIRRV